MRKRRLGNTMLDVSVIGLGGNNFGARIDFSTSERVVHAAMAQGINLIDTADCYGNCGGSEEALGRILSGRRNEIVLATKFGMPMGVTDASEGASPEYISKAVEASLKRLRTDWIDLYQLHRPDPHTPIAETLGALDRLIHQGKVRFAGCSNLSATEVATAQDIAWRNGLSAFVSCQDEYSLLERGIERDLVPTAHAYGLGILPYLPLAGGLLTGKYHPNRPLPVGSRFANSQRHAQQFMTARNWRVIEALQAFASKRNTTLSKLALAWLLDKHMVTSVIAGATTPQQVEENVLAATSKLSADEMTELDALTS